ncbi:MAG TPA: ABC transporter substrate-binding protein [Candidatus Limnocylindrales bacterium]
MSIFGSPRGVGGAAGSRWTALTGVAILAIVASACSSAATPAPATQAPASAAAGSQAPAASEAPASQAAGSLTIGSNNSDAVPKKALQDIVDAFTKETGVTVKINTIDHTTFQNQLSSYLQGTPEDVITWFSGHRMRFFANQGLFTPIDDVWAKVGSNYTDAMKTASTNDDGHQYLVPFDTYAWTVYYRKSVWDAKGYQVPKTLADMITLAKKMQTDGLVPIGLGDKDGWPAMGHFDILDLRTNGYQFHIDLMNGKAKWTDPKVKAVFEVWKTLLPYYQTGAAGRIWQDACAGLVQKKTGMMLQPQCAQTFAAASAADLADLAFFPWPAHGTPSDAENALDAPIDGYMITAKSPTLNADLANAKAFLAFLAKGSTQLTYAKSDPSLIGTAKDVDTSGYTPLQQAQAKVIGDAQKLTQFLDRDARSDLAGPNGMQAFLVNFLQNPNQDLDAYLKKIQDFVDSLGPET